MHQAGTKAPGLHAIGRTTHIEVDLVVAEIGADARRLRQLLRIGTTQLQRHRVLRVIEPEQALAIAVHQRGGGDHLRVQPRMRRQQPMEITAMPIRPIHHRCDGQAVHAGTSSVNSCT